jgi:hypothetical protein
VIKDHSNQAFARREKKKIRKKRAPPWQNNETTEGAEAIEWQEYPDFKQIK